MTGPEHYEAAEACLWALSEASKEGSFDAVSASALMAKAQVHAMLALAAVQALKDPELGLLPDLAARWHAVAA